MDLNPHHNARQELRKLQELDGIPSRSFSAQEIDQVLLSRGWQSLLSKPNIRDDFTKLMQQTSGIDGIIKQLADEVLNAVPQKYRDTLKHVPIGVLNTHFPYGEVRDAKEGGQFIVFHRGILTFIHDMARILVAGTILAPAQNRERGGLLLVALARKALHVCLLFRADIQIKGTHFVELPEELNLQADLCRLFVEKFCILHEYAHILQGRNQDCILAEYALKDQDTRGMSKKQISEIEADLWATTMMIEGTHQSFWDELPKASEWRLAAPCIFFGIVHFYESLFNKTEKGQQKR